MRWTEEDKKTIERLFNEGKTSTEISEIVIRTPKAIRIMLGKIGLKYGLPNSDVEVVCGECSRKFTSKLREKRIFCSHSCSAKNSNKNRAKKTNRCLNCNASTPPKNIYCSSECSVTHRKYMKRQDLLNGSSNLGAALCKLFLIEEYGNKCMECGWCEINKKTGKVPVELEHVDGNSNNNSLKNLKLLCPNCHSLTPTYRALNKGNGRFARMVRHSNGQSF